MRRILSGLMAIVAGGVAVAQDAKSAAPQVDEKERTVSFAAKVGKLDVFEELQGVIEYVLVLEGGKQYESLLVSDVDPLALVDGLKKIGLEPGKPAEDDGAGNVQPPKGAKVRIFAEWEHEGKKRHEPIESFVVDAQEKGAMKPVGWVFTGSRMGYDPDRDKEVLQVLVSGNLVGLHQGDGTTLFQNPIHAEDGHRYKGNKETLPPTGTALKIILKAAE